MRGRLTVIQDVLQNSLASQLPQELCRSSEWRYSSSIVTVLLIRDQVR